MSKKAKQAQPPIPTTRSMTVRQAIRREIEISPLTAQELSRRISIKEKEVADHLVHLEKTLKHEGKKLIIHPSQCLDCNFVFKNRSRYNRPSACPECRRSRITPPAFSC